MSKRQQVRLDFLINFVGELAQFSKAVNTLKRDLSTVAGLDSKIRSTRAAVTKKYYDDPRYMGSIIGGKSPKELETYSLTSESIRGRTAAGSLRHEVGKLRNILLLVAFATSGVVASFKEFFTAVVKTEAALNSLNSVAANTGLMFDKLKSYAVNLENTGIMSLTGSVSAIKNLAATKLTLNETVAVMNALTDAAAFNRQGTLSWEEAVIGATQGIKNQNSIMVDNAGITKNVSIMYRDYAISLGKTVGKLSETEKRQAIVNGIISEAGIFAGDAERAMNTYQGRLARFNTEILKLQRAFGELIAPGVLNMIEKVANFMRDTRGMMIVSTGIQQIIRYAKEATSVLLGMVNIFENAINVVGYMFYPIIKALDFFKAEFYIFGVLVVKLMNYLTGLATKARAVSSRELSNIAQSAFLKTAIFQQMKVGTTPVGFEQRFTYFQKLQKLQESEKETQGTIQNFIQRNLSSRIKELMIRSQSEKIARTELALLQEQARLAGFQLMKKTVPKTVGIVQMDKTHYQMAPLGKKMPGWTRISGEPLPSENVRASMSLYEKFISSVKEFGVQTKASFFQMKLGIQQAAVAAKMGFTQMVAGFKGVKAGVLSVKDALNQMQASSAQAGIAFQNMSAGFSTFFKSIVTAITSGLSALLRLVSYAMYIMMLVEWVKSIIDGIKEKEVNFQKHWANLQLELRSRKELLRVSEQEKKLIEVMNSASNSRFLELRAKSGERLVEVYNSITRKQYELKLETDKYYKMLKDGVKDEEKLDKQLKVVIDTRTELNALTNKGKEITEGYNESFDKTIENLKEFITSLSGAYTDLFSSHFEYMDSLEENRASMFQRLAQEIDTSRLRILGKNLEGNNAYYLMEEMALTKHQINLQRITIENEKKLLAVKKQIRDESLKGFESTLYSEFLAAQNNYKNMIDSINQQIQDIKLNKVLSDIQSDVFNLFNQMFSQQLKTMVQSTKSNIQIFQNEVTSAFEKFGLGAKNTIEAINQNINNMFPSTSKSGKLFYSEAIQLLHQFKTQVQDVTKETGETIEKSGYNLLKSAAGVEVITMQKIQENLKGLTAAGVSVEDILKRESASKELKASSEELSTVRKQWEGLIDMINKSDNIQLQEAVIPHLQQRIKEVNDFSNLLSNLENAILAVAGANKTLTENEKGLLEIESKRAAVDKYLKNHIGVLNELRDAVKGNYERSLNLIQRQAADTLQTNIELEESYRNVATGVSGFEGHFESLRKIMESSNLEQAKWLAVLKRSKEDYILAGIGVEEWDSRIQAAYRNLRIIARTNLFIELTKKIREFNKAFNESTASFKLFNKTIGLTLETGEAINLYSELITDLGNKFTLIQAAFINGYAQTEKLVIEAVGDFVVRLRDEHKNIIGTYNDLKSELLLSQKSMDATLGKSFFDYLFGFPSEDLASIEAEYEQKIDAVYEKIKVIIDARKTANAGLNILGYFDPAMVKNIKNSAQYNALTSESKALLDSYFDIIDTYRKQKEIESQKYWLQFYTALFSGITQGVMALGNVIFQEIPDLERDKAKMLKDQEELFRRGEISEQEHGRRVAEINKYYAEEVNRVWEKTAKSVASNILEMMSQILVSMASAAAAKKAVEGGTFLETLGGIAAGLGAALPYLGIAAVLGLGASALSASTPSEVPTFEGAEKDTLSKFGGTIKAEDVVLTISPTFIIEGDQVFIGSGSVVEYVDEATELMKKSIQQAIDNREIDLSSIRRA